MNSFFIPTTRNVSWEIFSFDLNNDGTKDFILFDQSKNALIPFTSVGKNTWTEDEKLFLDSDITVAEKPQILFDDLNKDGYKDLLVYGLGLTCLVFSSQLHLETLAPLVDLFFHSDMNSAGVL